jgi:hypothetical protein
MTSMHDQAAYREFLGLVVLAAKANSQRVGDGSHQILTTIYRRIYPAQANVDIYDANYRIFHARVKHRGLS